MGKEFRIVKMNGKPFSLKGRKLRDSENKGCVLQIFFLRTTAQEMPIATPELVYIMNILNCLNYDPLLILEFQEELNTDKYI